MKLVAEIVAVITLLVSGVFIAPKAVKKFKIETIRKLDKGLPQLQSFTSKLTKPK